MLGAVCTKRKTPDRETARCAETIPFDDDPLPTRGRASSVLAKRPRAGHDRTADAGSLPPRQMSRILLVEDNELSRDMLSRRLTRRGYEVLTAVDGAEAVETARTGTPDLILMDMSLPVIDGWEATRRLKAEPDTCAIPIIALTALAMASDERKARDAGCDDFDTKPVDLPRLLEKVERWLGASQGM